MSVKRGREPWSEHGEELEDDTWLDHTTGKVCWCAYTGQWPCPGCIVDLQQARALGVERCCTPELSQEKVWHVKHSEKCTCKRKGSGGSQPNAGRHKNPTPKLEDEKKRVEHEIKFVEDEQDVEK